MRERILIVEDEPAISEAVEYALRAEGFEVEAVDDGNTALAQARARAYDLLATLIARNEKRIGSTEYDFAAQPREYVDRMMQGISPFEMEIQALEGKFKLGQERSDGDRNGVLAHLARGEYKERSLYDLTQAFYKSPPK